MFVRNDRVPEPSVHLSLLSLMEELLLPPEHSLSSPPLRAEKKGASIEEEGENGATATRHVCGEKRKRKGKIEEWYSKKE